MSIYKELSFDHDVDKIRGIRFCVLSPDEIRRMSVAEVFKTDTYVGNEPVVNGLFDSRMGVLDHNKVCQTCEEKNTFCPGHFGHINLAKPVFYIQFFDIVKKLLKCVCFRCSKLLVNAESEQIKTILNKKYTRQKRWELLYKLCSKVKRCGQETIDGCGAKQPDKIYREPIVKIIMEWKDLAEESKKQVMNAEEVLRILKRISDHEAEVLGFSPKYNRPEWMISTVFPVPPPAVRPSVRTDTGQRSEDDLTHKLCDIVKSNNALKMKIEKGASKEQVDIAAQVLQYHVATFIDNKIPGINPAQQRTGRLLKSLTERLKSKDGRIRGNLMGKRVDFSARSVITPDPNISIDELGVPLKIAMNLTFPEVVNEYNREKLMKMVINGPDKYPGAKFIRKGQWTKALKNMPNRESIVLENGDVVDRHLTDGDVVLFNRQPSLHKYSMLCHRIKVMPYNTFRLNVCVCSGYNADFDGDEMNMHVPQSITTANELMELAAVANQIISVRECKPIIGVVQDVALGIYRLTKSNVQLSQKQFFNLLCNNVKFTGDIPDPAIVKGNVQKWTGRQSMSTIIPKIISVKSPNKSYEGKDTSEDQENFVVIENGELHQGIVDKLIYQNRTKGLVHSIFNECGPQETRIFFDNTQKLICDWLVQSGFSVGISDLIVDGETTNNLKQMIHDMKVKVYDMIRDIHMGVFENKSISTNSDYFESEVNKILNQTISNTGKVATSKINDLENRMINMVKSGSKGSIINVSQMIACLGQQNVDGKRIPYGFDDRTLPHYTKYDDGPESRGFVQNSFVNGLSPQEFFFHSMGGREGLIDTAVKSVTGDTTIVIIEDNSPKYVKIGEWIDDHMKSNQQNIQHYPQDRNMEFLPLATEVFIPSSDNNGIVTWNKLTAVTRHDPGEKLFTITTMGGRKVTVAESESLIVWNTETKTFDPMHSTKVHAGDYLPVTASLCKPPVLQTYVDMTKYFPKDTTNIMDDHEHALIPAQFDMSEENGIFIGLYIAEGSSCVKSGKVSITNIDPTIKDFVKKWFLKLSITYTEHTTIDKVGETSSTIDGSSTQLARFLDMFVGHESSGKYIPNEAFSAPDEFVCGLLSGYFSGNGTVSKTSIESSSASARLAEGIVTLCSRIGVYAKMVATQTKNKTHSLSIIGQWANVFSKKIELISPTKQKQLTDMTPSETHQNLNLHNDVVLDEIVSIDIQDTTGHTKLYDVTVPSTLNFAISNGLTCRDTSEIGYLQRKLVKAMEDCKIGYDYTVRNASGSIIQFLYGEDGMDASKIESQSLPFIEMDLAKLRKEYLMTREDPLKHIFTDAATAEITAEGDAVYDRCKTHYEQLIQDRDYMIEYIFDKKKETSIMYPVSFMRIINIAKSVYKHERGLPLDITPMYILDIIDTLCKELHISRGNPGNRFMNILLRLYLSPKKVIYDYKFSKMAFDHVVQQVRLKFYDSIAHPSEMVGVIAAQSIGEPCTQMTLNSVEWNTEMLFDIDGTLTRVKIGEFIDNILTEKITVENHPNDTRLGWIKERNIKVLSCDEKGKITWKLVEAVTQHPPINEDGSNVLLKVITKSGREVIATKAKSFLTRKDNRIVPLRGDELKVGDFLPVSNILPTLMDCTQWDISCYVPKTEFVYMSEVEKALAIHKTSKENGRKHWFNGQKGKTFEIPYTRSDGFLNAFVGVGDEKDYYNGKRRNLVSQSACVYPKNTIYQPAHIPEKIELDNLTGFFIGAYLAEGCCTTHHVLISNLDDDFNAKIHTFCERYALKYHVDERTTHNGAHSKTIRIHSIVMARLLTQAIGRTSYKKRIPQEFFAATDGFIQGLVDGYVSGDGCVDKKLNALSITSVSRGLLEDFQQILSRYGIQSCISACESALKQAVAKGFKARLPYKLQLNASNTYKFKFMFTLSVNKKQARLECRNQAQNIDKIDMIPNIITKTFGTVSIPRSQLQNYIEKCENDEDKQILLDVLAEDIFYDEVILIEEVVSDHPYVYDLTVQDTRNFNIYNGLCMRDTFHLSGVSSASKAVRGVPRIKELLSVTKNIKAPAMNIYLYPEINKNKMKSKDVLNKIETTYFKDIVTSTKIYYDPDDFNTTIEEDRLFVQSYAEFIDIEKLKAQNLSPWLLRMEFDKGKMLEYQLSMIDIYHVLNDFYEDNISAMFSDDNSNKLVFRIKIHEDLEPSKEEDRDIITELKALEKNILETINIKGVRKVNKVSMSKKEFFEYNPDTMLFDKTHEWVLESNGTNLLDIMCVPHVDISRTVSNNINEIYEIFGIEAARQALYNEIYSVIKDADLYVNYRHIALLVDTMTNKGYIISIDRHGINRVDIGPLAKSSFEETTDMLIKAGIFSEVDRINGVSANIMLGQIPPCGTGDTDVLIDELKLAEQFEHVEEESEDNNDLQCDSDVLTFDFTLPEIDSNITKKIPTLKIVK